MMYFWPSAAQGAGGLSIVAGSLAVLTGVNVIEVRSAARTGILLAFGNAATAWLCVVIGLFHIDGGLV